MLIHRMSDVSQRYSKSAQASSWLLAGLVAMAFLLGDNFAHAQQITGAIAGTVTDPAGAVVPNASIHDYQYRHGIFTGRHQR